MVPSLSLEYSTQSGDGVIGVGWTLNGLSSITRCPRTLAQDGVHGSVNYDTSDRLCMDGQRLTYVSGGTGSYGASGSVYRTENESFSKVVQYGDINDPTAHFEVWTKSGQHLEFGTTLDSQVLTVGLGSNVIRSWAVHKITDTVGNYLTVTYNCAESSGSCTDTDRTQNGESYPLRIDYTGHNTAPTVSPYNSVRFSYCSRDSSPVCARADSVPMYQAGAKTQSTVILWDIQTYQGNSLVYDYRLDYRRGTTATHSRLTSVTQCGVSHCLAPTTFNWQGGAGYLSPNTVINNPLPDAQGQTLYPGDFNGDGLTDVALIPTGILSECSAFPYYYGNGPAFPSIPSGYVSTAAAGAISCNVKQVQTTVAPSGLTQLVMPISATFCNHPDCTPPGTHSITSVTLYTSNNPAIFWKNNTLPGAPIANYLPGDLNGDGLVDFFQQQSSTGYGYIYNIGGYFTQDGGHSGLGSGTVALAAGDFDGDGCADFLAFGASANNVNYVFCNPAVPTASAPSISGFNVTLGDFNGDGKIDMLLTANGTAGKLYLSTGRGFVLVNSALPSDWGKYAIRIGDWNGDGKADLLLIASGASGYYGSGTSHKLYISTGTDFTAAVDGSGTPITIANSAATAGATIADWNNDGASDVWLQQPVVSGVGDQIYTYAYTPELITGISNGITSASGGAGPTTIITYAPLNTGTSFYTPDASTSYPSQSLNGAVYVVSEVDASNGIGTCTAPGGANCYTSTYTYAGATANLTGRGFQGFSTIKIVDHQTGIIQTTNYNKSCNVPVGLSAPYLECPKMGLIDSQTKVCPTSVSDCHSAAATLNSITNTYTATNLGGTSNFVGLSESVVSGHDLNNAALPTTTTDYAYDSYGNALTVNVTVFDPNASATSYKYTTSTYNNDTANWFLGRLATTSVRSIVGASDLTRNSLFCYDSGTGLLTKEVVEPGALTCSSNSPGTYTLVTDYGYDAFGHRTSTTVSGGSGGTSIAARTSYVGYDSVGQFQISATNALGQSESWSYDARFGTAAAHTGPNGLTTSWSYDDIGRRTLEVRPDGTRTVTGFDYCSGVNGGSASCVSYGAYLARSNVYASDGSTQIAPNTVSYFDMLSRTVAGDTQGFDGSVIRVSTIYDANGRVSQSSRPYFPTAPPCPGGAPCWTTYVYDAIGRVTQTTFPDGSIANSTYNGLTTSVTRYPDPSSPETTTTTKNAQGLVASVVDATSHTTTYAYDAFDNLIAVTDPASNTVRNSYNIRGNRTDSYDPDMGHWVYAYDALGELITQTDAKGLTTSLGYDLLGRTATRSEPGLYSSWTYGVTPTKHDVGQLIEAKSCADGGCGTLVSDRTFQFDGLGRQILSLMRTPTDYYGYGTTYDAANGLIASISYPSGLTVNRSYNSYGFVTKLTQPSGIQVWQALARDAELHLISQVAGNGVTTTQSFNPQTGLIQQQRAGPVGAVASFDYSFDAIGDLKARSDNTQTFTERFCYDSLNRLTNWNIGSACTGGNAASYDPIGNLTAKSGAGNYSYSAAGPHQVSSISGPIDGLTNPQYTYDPNGNLTCVSTGSTCSGTVGRTVAMTSFNMTQAVAQGGSSLSLTYDDRHRRIRQYAVVSGTPTETVYVNDDATGAMSERVTTGPSTATVWNAFTWNAAPWAGTLPNGAPTFIDYITVDGQIVAQHTVQYPSATAWGRAVWNSFTWGPAPGSVWGSTAPNNPPRFTWGTDPWSGPIVNWSWFVLDHLGSVAVITNQAGAVAQRLSYDPWGRQRNSDGTAAACGAIASPTTRGFTNQEQLPPGVACAVNLNARLYDPTIGKFLAADPMVGDPTAPNAFNRYSYVLNNPLSFTDPTGLCFLGCFWKTPVFNAVLGIGLALVGLPELEGFNVFASGFQFSSIGLTLSVANAAAAGGITAGVSGGNVLKGALYGGLSAGLASGVGAPLGAFLGKTAGTVAGNFIAQGLVGGGVNAIFGGDFGSGFLAAGFGSLGSSLGISGGKFSTGSLAVSAVLGGIGAEFGGGKFANGAVTGAFAYAAGSLGTEDARTGGAMGSETGDDASLELAKFSGVTSCGNSLCGNIPYSCAGSACSMVIDELQTFAKNMSFNLSFSPATSWQKVGSWFGIDEVLNINFGATYTEGGGTVLGEGGGGVINLLGSRWQSDPRITNHEFLHDLGLGHNSAPGTLMYPYISPGTSAMPQPGERSNLINGYGH